MCDREGVNKNSLRKLKDIYGYIHIGNHLIFLQVWYIYHTLSNAGKQLNNKYVNSWIESFHNTWQKGIQYRGNTRDPSNTEFGKSVKDAGWVRFYAYHEQIVQIFDCGLDRILKEIIQTCIEMNESDGSTSYLTEKFGTNGTFLNWKWLFWKAVPFQIQDLYFVSIVIL